MTTGLEAPTPTPTPEPVAWLYRSDDAEAHPFGFGMIAPDAHEAIKELVGAFPVYDYWAPADDRAKLAAGAPTPEPVEDTAELLRLTRVCLLDANEKIMDLEAKIEWHKSVQRALATPVAASQPAGVGMSAGQSC